MKKPTIIERLKALIFGAPAKQAPAKKPAAQAPAKREPYVYVTAQGKKFHFDPCCPAILTAYTEGKAIQMDLSKAKAAGRTACNKCCYDYLHD